MSEGHRIVIVDRDPAMRDFLQACLTARGYDALALAGTHDTVARCALDRPAAVVLALGASGGAEELDAITALKAMEPDMPVIVISGRAQTPVIVEAMKRGASDFVAAPFDEADLELALAKALKHPEAAGGRVGRWRERDAVRPLLLGHSSLMTEVRDFIERAATTDVTVLVRGESGTGKTLVAREIVAASDRWDKPFVTIACAGRETGAVEAELIGALPRAFGDLRPLGRGGYETAHHGTLFLDEVGDLPAPLQARLLQILQNGDLRREDDVVDARIIAATSRDLEQAVARGTFREDLFFRLNVVSLHLPPLRDRREDIPVLSRYFLEKYSAQYRTPPARPISAPMMRRFMEHEWPGNVRELENLMRRAVLLGTEAALAEDMGPPAGAEPQAAPVGVGSLKELARSAARETERALILDALEQTHWNRKEAAAMLGISYKALLNKIKESDLQNG